MVMSPFGLDHSGYYTDIFETLDNADWQLSHRQITLDWKAPASPLNALFKKISETNNTYGQRLANPAINTTYSESECPASKLTLLTIPSIVP
ncbi:hypothetical protein GCM10027217_22520 [Pseudomaricurvus hydrocarbonicus]